MGRIYPALRPSSGEQSQRAPLAAGAKSDRAVAAGREGILDQAPLAGEQAADDELLGELASDSPERGSVADLGTGSGVLAIAAALLGYGPVLALDHELPAVEAAAANAELNGATVDVARRNLREQPGPPARIWLANLTAPLLVAVAGLMPAPGEGGPEQLVVSGLLARERGLVEEAFAARGYSAIAFREGGEWGALRLAAG